MDTVAELIKRTAFKITHMGQLVGNLASERLGVPFGIVDLSLAPTPAPGDSVANIDVYKRQARRYARAYGGRLLAGSAPERGACFSLCLPLCPPGAAPSVPDYMADRFSPDVYKRQPSTRATVSSPPWLRPLWASSART